MARTKFILCACVLACVAVFFYSNSKLLSNISAEARFISYHYSDHKPVNKLKNKRPYTTVVKIKVRYVASDYSYALQPDVTYSFTKQIVCSRVFIPIVSFVYKYPVQSKSLRGPPLA